MVSMTPLGGHTAGRDIHSKRGLHAKRADSGSTELAVQRKDPSSGCKRGIHSGSK
jgi:hypothetical protein